jgi:hypothetical protein
MAGNPLVSLGTLNRLRGSVVVNAIAALNVTAPFLGKDGISLALDGNTTSYIDVMVGSVTSPEPYQRASVTINLLRTQFLAGAYKARIELNSLIGDVTVYPDSTQFPTYQFSNCSIMSVAEVRMNGTDPGYRIQLGGIYAINSALWNLV